MQKLLLVDDEPDALEVLTWMRTDRGYDVRAETQAERALEVGREFEPDPCAPARKSGVVARCAAQGQARRETRSLA